MWPYFPLPPFFFLPPNVNHRCDSATKTSSSCATHSKAFPPTSRSTPRRSDPCKARTVGWDCARTSPCES
eukprot:scaffold2722_cov197-Isochrysis_galbana.AAC.2